MAAATFEHWSGYNGSLLQSAIDYLIIILREQGKTKNVNKLVPVRIKLSMRMKNSSPNAFHTFRVGTQFTFILLKETEILL